jgi:hypothetical protein
VDQLPPVPSGVKVVQNLPLGRFRNDQMGTGEGAQAYGYGSYQAESQNIGKRYRDALKHRALTPEFMEKIRDVLAGLDKEPTAKYDDALLGTLNGSYSGPLPREPFDSRHPKTYQIAGKIASLYDTKEDPLQEAMYLQAQFSHLRDEGSSLKIGPKRSLIAGLIENVRNTAKGSLYHSRINAHPEHFLDWDKPLSEQSEHVRGALEKAAPYLIQKDTIFGASRGASGYRPMTDHPNSGRKIYRDETYPTREEAKKAALNKAMWTEARGGSPQTSQTLLSSGIRGIRYLDQGSRGAGKGTHNYVVFDPNDIEIMKRYAQGGMVYHGHLPRHAEQNTFSSDLPGGTVDRALALTPRNSFATGAGRPHNAPATRRP